MNIVVNGVELLMIVVGVAKGVPVLINPARRGLRNAVTPSLILLVAVTMPGAVNWLVIVARDANLFA